ncbi:endonuclease domain-containing protein [Arthrobacter sulfonylureivorans]|uniref:Endonuclease VII domain-containing protein n=1 Tax=Arthrobacter sulfonylureivorans TaxID=2486855 RepID=A0ABY3W9R2_9MICC|nr:endonuclease domain-containing protein [Arthrobacter sulfonylureivorans]UNK47094.1 endonuclease VII domain-containing protein [Arthrobacter sulfonylureivorans]
MTKPSGTGRGRPPGDHYIVNADYATMTGDCKTHGPGVPINAGGRCLQWTREQHREYRMVYDVSGRLNDTPIHYISNADYDARIGDCFVCGPGARLDSQGRCAVAKLATQRRSLKWYYYPLNDGTMTKLPVDERDKLLADSHCFVCRGDEELHVDHDHETGEIRGVLCRIHNHMIGECQGRH